MKKLSLVIAAISLFSTSAEASPHVSKTVTVTDKNGKVHTGSLSHDAKHERNKSDDSAEVNRTTTISSKNGSVERNAQIEREYDPKTGEIKVSRNVEIEYSKTDSKAYKSGKKSRSATHEVSAEQIQKKYKENHPTNSSNPTTSTSGGK